MQIVEALIRSLPSEEPGPHDDIKNRSTDSSFYLVSEMDDDEIKAHPIIGIHAPNMIKSEYSIHVTDTGDVVLCLNDTGKKKEIILSENELEVFAILSKILLNKFYGTELIYYKES